tara:strand:- start:3686 stop:3961 length:276 start_codon:yes stop_codon:yes gene_type:complete
MDLLFSDQAQPILIIALVAGLVIGIAVFALAGRRRAPHAAGHPRTEKGFQTPRPPARAAPAARRTLPTDTRQRATNLIEDIARFYQNRHTG